MSQSEQLEDVSVLDECSRDSGFESDLDMSKNFSLTEFEQHVFMNDDANSLEENISCPELDNDCFMDVSIVSASTSTQNPLSDVTNKVFVSPKCKSVSFSQRAEEYKKLSSRKRPASRLPTAFTKLTKQTENEAPPQVKNLMIRTHSSSVLEVGQYSHQLDENLPQQLVVTYHLPVMTKVDSQAFRRIEASTLHNLMLSMSEEAFKEKYLLIDCRYPFEYNGGHIKNAINMFDHATCQRGLQGETTFLDNKIPIFYCEYSQKRGPLMANFVRSCDRKKNVDNYPHLNNQEMYVLNHGYRGFYTNYGVKEKAALFDPSPSYIPMDHPSFGRELGEFTQHKKGFMKHSMSLKSIFDRKDRNARLRKNNQMSGDSPSSSRTMSRYESAPDCLTTPPSKSKVCQPQFS